MATLDTHLPARHRNHMAGVGIRRLVKLGFEANPTSTSLHNALSTIPMTPAELFTAAARALYGDEFVAALDAELQEDDDTVVNWAAGKSRVPTGNSISTDVVQRFCNALPLVPHRTAPTRWFPRINHF